MKHEVNNTNNIFSFALVGALLFVAALTYTLAFLSNIVMLELSYTMIAIVLAASSISLLYKAVKGDRNRLGQV
jgi:hypothetical protein